MRGEASLFSCRIDRASVVWSVAGVRQGWALCSGVSGIVKRIFVAWFEFSCTYVVASKSAVDAVWARLLVSAQ